MRLNDYELIKKLGSGAQGSVYEAINPSGKRIALKVISAFKGSGKYRSAMREINQLEQISKPCHPNLVCYLGHSYDDYNDKVLIETEFIEGQDLQDYVRSVAPELKEKYLTLILKDLIKGVVYLHGKGIVHGDIKPANIMIEKDLTPVLIDVGVSCEVKPLPVCMDGACCEGYEGTPIYAAPEMLNTDLRYLVSDVWSLGVTLYYLLMEEYPFNFGPKPTMKQIINILSDNSIQPNKLEGDSILVDIINKSLVRNVNDRITSLEIENMLIDYN